MVNPDTIAAQVEGGALFGLTAALDGAITLKGGGVEQSNCNDYRPMRVNEVTGTRIRTLPIETSQLQS